MKCKNKQWIWLVKGLKGNELNLTSDEKVNEARRGCWFQVVPTSLLCLPFLLFYFKYLYWSRSGNPDLAILNGLLHWSCILCFLFIPTKKIWLWWRINEKSSILCLIGLTFHLQKRNKNKLFTRFWVTVFPYKLGIAAHSYPQLTGIPLPGATFNKTIIELLPLRSRVSWQLNTFGFLWPDRDCRHHYWLAFLWCCR